MLGLEQLFGMHGPPQETSDSLYIALVDSTRLKMTVAALYNRRPSLLAKPEWSAISSHLLSHAYDDPARLEIAYLLDTMAQLTILFSDREKLFSLEPTPGNSDGQNVLFSDMATIRSLLGKSLDILFDIQIRRTRWLESYHSTEYSCPPQSTAGSSQQPPVQEVTHFSSMHAANAFMLYNTVVILMHQFATSMYNQLPTAEHNLLIGDALSTKHISSAVEQILKGIDYHLIHSSEVPDSATLYVLLPVRVAFRVLAQSTSAEDVSRRCWLADVFSMVEGKYRPWTSNKQLFNVSEDG
jgi:hypothetical protein